MARHPSFEDVAAARMRIEPLVQNTPLVQSPVLSQGREVRLKLDCLQDTRAFKLRGAANAILSLPPERRRQGVTTYSTGNFGRAVAYVAHQVGIKAVVCVSARTSPEKLAALAESGAEVEIGGRSQDEAAVRATELARRHRMALIDPIEDPAVIAGHGTVALEVCDAWPEVDTFIVPVSGGALAAGIGLVAERRQVRVVGVSPERGAAMHASLAAGRPVEVEEAESLADSLQGGIGADNRHTFPLCHRLLAQLVLVSEGDLAAALAHGFFSERLVLEGAGAAPIAALQRHGKHWNGRICLVLTGSMIDPRRLLELVSTRTEERVQ